MGTDWATTLAQSITGAFTCAALLAPPHVTAPRQPRSWRVTPTPTTRALHRAVFRVQEGEDLRIRRVGYLLRWSVDAADADLWGDTIRHAAVKAALEVADSNRCRCSYPR